DNLTRGVDGAGRVAGGARRIEGGVLAVLRDREALEGPRAAVSIYAGESNDCARWVDAGELRAGRAWSVEEGVVPAVQDEAMADATCIDIAADDGALRADEVRCCRDRARRVEHVEGAIAAQREAVDEAGGVGFGADAGALRVGAAIYRGGDGAGKV